MRSWYGIGDILHWLLDKNSDNCETLRKRELNYGKLTRAKENTGEPPVLRRQVRHFLSGLCIYCTDRAKMIQE